jgi:hypothetical protein
MTLHEAVLICRGTTNRFRRKRWLSGVAVAVLAGPIGMPRNHMFGDYDHSDLVMLRDLSMQPTPWTGRAFAPSADDAMAEDYEVVQC